MRHRRSLIAVCAYVGAVFATHCSFTNDLDSFGVGSPDAGQSNDAHNQISDSGTPDTSSAEDSAPGDDAGQADTAVADTSPPDDVDADAGPADTGPVNDPPLYAEAGATKWCDAHATSAFCADFDEAPLPSGFTSSEGSFLSLTSTLSSSKSNDLLLLIPAQSGSGTISSKLSRSFTQSASSVILAFDFYPENVNTTPSGILFAAIDFLGNAAAKFSVRLAYNQGATRIEESFLGFPTDIFHSSFNLPIGAWSRVRLELTFGPDGGASTMATYVNEVLQGTKDALSPQPGTDTRPSLLIGAVYGTLPINGWAFRYDNITLDIK